MFNQTSTTGDEACGTILPLDSICCMQCGQIHNESDLLEFLDRLNPTIAKPSQAI